LKLRPPLATPDAPPTPGQVLAARLAELGLTQYRLAADAGIKPIAVSEIIRGMRQITPETACRLARYLGGDPLDWLTLEARHEIARVLEERGDWINQIVPFAAREAGKDEP
jgi:addiction module HigA family antidote